MRKSLNKDTIINMTFYFGLAIKAVNALAELISGFLMMILNHNQLNLLIRFIALPELKEDPKDIAMNYFITLGQNFSINSQHSVAIYMIIHGTTKLTVIWLLLNQKLWSYPIAVIVFGFFVIFEIYNYTHTPSVLLLLLIIIDIVMIAMIILEYKQLKWKK